MTGVPFADGLQATRWPRGLRPAGPAEAGFDPGRLERAFGLLEAEIAAGQLPGAVAVIARDGAVAAHRALGWAAVHPARRPMAPDTLFDLASLTKVMATLPAVLLLIDRGEIRLDDPLHLFFPEYRGEGREEIRIRHLLTHTAGFPPGSPVLREPAGSRAERIARLASVPLQAPPGSRIIYSDLGFILLGELVAKVSGQPLDRFVREQVHRPLGLVHAGYLPSGDRARSAAATEYRERLGRHQCGEVHDENATALGGVAGHAGLFATAPEVAAYGQMWLEGGAGVLSPAAVAAATRDQTPHLPGQEHRGLGWIVAREDSAGLSCGDLFSPGSFGHTGFTGTSLWIDPHRRLVVALLTNRVHFGRTDHILRLRPRFHNAVAAAVIR
ncbi:CubicO group peptidase (beta-lactamase class C family) [Symbiobacterium terraclitae]|uniref:CubicO group peptidase (Beta-lactamase class C family) n=1 Tax=Symbiobacterium terraclitae TaxID=557451 RepID=A0ABS4JRC6_9FIRM|nr:serine hydrolase [Symbiobacterium terraclitae]MBP2017505.1 CubicO group peptidase (beta-lactamase class C family) [Symbiobacterium terraclitae]